MPSIHENVLTWIGAGRVGSSSKAMALTACGIPSEGCYPSDPDDLNRCLLLLEAVPEVRDHFEKIAAIGVVWGRLIARWPEIEKSFLDEVGRDWCNSRSAPKTYALMKEVIREEPGVIRFGAVRFKAQ